MTSIYIIDMEDGVVESHKVTGHVCQTEACPNDFNQGPNLHISLKQWQISLDSQLVIYNWQFPSSGIEDQLDTCIKIADRYPNH